MKYPFLLIPFVFISANLQAGPFALLGVGRRITFNNMLNKPVYAAVYHAKKNKAIRRMQPVPIPANSITTFKIPKPLPLTSRLLFSSTQLELLPQTLNRKDGPLSTTPPLSVGLFKNNDVILTANNQLIYVDKKNKSQAEYLTQEIIKNDPHSHKVAHVSQHINEAGPEEHSFITKRLEVARLTLKKLLKRQIHPTQTPLISVGIGGGSMRAMLASYGLLQGLKKIGLLNTILYYATISGSCWAPPCWLAANKDLDSFMKEQVNRYQIVPSMKKLIRRSIAEYRNIKYLRSQFGFSTSISHCFGVMLSKVFLKPMTDHYQKLTLSGLAKNLDPATYPFPIMTAVSRMKTMREMSYHWLEYSPYDIRLVTGDYCIPSWASMRRFEDGASIDQTPEFSLSSLLGLWGSAFSLSLDEVLVRLPDRILRWLPDSIMNRLLRSKKTHKKFLTEQVPNFTYQMANNSDLTDEKTLLVSDAGHCNNLPAIPFTHAGREQDLLIILNASIDEASNMPIVYQFRKNLQKRFPKMTFDIDTVMGKPISYWPSSDFGTPNLIMISLHKVESFDPSFNPRIDDGEPLTKLRYSPQDVTQLTGLLSHIVTENKPLFTRAINDVMRKIQRGGHVAKNKDTDKSIFSWLPASVNEWLAS